LLFKTADTGKVEPSLAERQRMLKRARLGGSLNGQLSHRPGPLELIQKNILHTDENVERAVKGTRKKRSPSLSPCLFICYYYYYYYQRGLLPCSLLAPAIESDLISCFSDCSCFVLSLQRAKFRSGRLVRARQSDRPIPSATSRPKEMTAVPRVTY